MKSVNVVAAVAAIVAVPAAAQSRAQLPIAEGFWVQASKSCSAAQEVHIYKGNRFGAITSYRGSIAAPLERVDRVEPSSRGFVRFFSYFNGNRARGEMPSAYEIAARAGGQAVIRASSYASGEVAWSHIARQCALEELSANLRMQAQRLGVLPTVAGPRSTLPLPLGYYNSGSKPCERETEPDALVKLTASGLANNVDGGPDFASIKQVSPGRYEVVERYLGNESDGVRNDRILQTSIYEIITPTSFRHRTLPQPGDGPGAGRPTVYNYCNQSRVPHA